MKLMNHVLRCALAVAMLVGSNHSWAAADVSTTKALEDSLLHVLDKVIGSKNDLMKAKYVHIDSLKHALLLTSDVEDIMSIQEDLFDAYKSFRMDSAIYYAQSLYEMKQHVGDTVGDARCRMNIAEALNGMGQYQDAKLLLDSIDRLEGRDDSIRQQRLYYAIYHQRQLSVMDRYTQDAYRDSIIACKERIMEMIPHESIEYETEAAHLLLEQDKAWEALSHLQTSMKIYDCDLDASPILTRELANIYLAINHKDEAIVYLAYSAIADLREVKKQYTSLQRLAILLFERGDLERAYHYIMCDMEDVTFCQSKAGLVELNDYLPIITSTYSYQAAEKRKIQLLLIGVIGAFLVGLIFVGITLHRHSRQLRDSREETRLRNEQLEETNASMRVVAEQLNQANQAKEACIAEVFNLCSIYMDKLDRFRKTVSTMLKGNQTKELGKMVNEKAGSHADVKELFDSFDHIFLSIYPHFVEDFQHLLKEGEWLEIKSGELLSPELRIYALVRLGITDSMRIASFLHFTPQTIYNYRMRMRARTNLSKEEFIDRVQHL